MEKPQADPPKWSLWAILAPFLCLLPLNTASTILRDEVFPFGPSRPSLEFRLEGILLFATLFYAVRRYFLRISLKKWMLSEILLTFIVLMFEVSIRSCKIFAFCKSFYVKELASICFDVYNLLYQSLEIRYQIHLHQSSPKSNHGVGFLYANMIAIRIIPHIITQIIPNADYRENLYVILSAYAWIVVAFIVSIVAFYYIQSTVPNEILMSNLIEKEEEKSVEEKKGEKSIEKQEEEEKFIEEKKEEKFIEKEKQEEEEKFIEEKKEEKSAKKEEEKDESSELDMKKYLAWLSILLFCGMNHPKLNALKIVQYASWIPRYAAHNPWDIDWRVLFGYLWVGWAFLVTRVGKIIEKYDKNVILRYVVALAALMTVLHYLSLILENTQWKISTLCGLWGLNDLVLLIALTKISTEFDGEWNLFAVCNALFYFGGFFKSVIDSLVDSDDIEWRVCFYSLFQISMLSQFFKSPLSKIGKIKL